MILTKTENTTMLMLTIKVNEKIMTAAEHAMMKGMGYSTKRSQFMISNESRLGSVTELSV